MAVGHIVTGCPCSSTYKVLLSITGLSGALTGLGIARGYSYHYFKISIDGKPIVENYFCAGDSENNGMGVNLPFNRDLLIEVKDSIPSAMTQFWASCVLSGSKIREEKFEPLDGYVYRMTEFEIEKKIHTVKSLVGHERVSKVILDKDAISEGEEITGRVELRNWEGKLLYDADGCCVPVFLRPVARSAAFSPTKTESVKEGVGTFKMELPKFKGNFEVLADLTDYANIPAYLTIL